MSGPFFPSGESWPAPVTRLDRVDSTSSWLMSRARQDAPEWTAVVADSQSAGRGRGGRVWESPRGNLFLSVLLRGAWRPGLPDTLVPLAAGVAVAKVLRRLGVPVRLKWPNDLVCGERKLGGILAEGVVSSSRLEGIVVGVGVNLGLQPGSLPAELRDRVTSVCAERGDAPGRDRVAADVLEQLRCELSPPHDAPALLAEWRGLSVEWWGRAVRVESAGETLHGIARELDAGGGLVLELPGGARRVVVSGEAHRLRPAGPG